MHIFAWIAFHSTDGNYEKPSHMASTKINLSKAMNVQMHHKAQRSITVSVLRTWALPSSLPMKSRNNTRSCIRTKHCGSRWLFFRLPFLRANEVWLYPRNPLDICLTLHKELAPERAMTSNHLDGLSPHFVWILFIFLILAPYEA